MEFSTTDQYALMPKEDRQVTLDSLEQSYHQYMDLFINNQATFDDIEKFAILVSGMIALQKAEIVILNTEISHQKDQLTRLMRNNT